MKQNITVRELDSIPYEKSVEIFKVIGIDRSKESLVTAAKILNVGIMIQTLEKDFKITIDGNCSDESVESNPEFAWAIVLYRKELGTMYHQFLAQGENLCDALWKAIKVVFEC